MHSAANPGRSQEPGNSPKKLTFVEVANDGSLVVPHRLARRLGLVPGARLRVEEHDQHFLLHRPVTLLNHLYIEPTNDCPFACTTCMRHTWREPLGQMSEDVFDRIIAGLTEADPVTSVFFGGFGEPLSHPGIIRMIHSVKALGARVELITNGLLLGEELIKGLIEVELDCLWVSLDGATPECYGEIRESDAYSRIVENLHLLNSVKWHRDICNPALGIAFVAMKRNQSELREVLRLGLRLGAIQFSVSNVQPHTQGLQKEVLYEKSLGQNMCDFKRFDLARMDGGGEWDHEVANVLADCGLHFDNGRGASRSEDSCPFVEKGSMSICWDGQSSPCLPLLHSHTAYLDRRPRTIKEHSFGSVMDHTLREIWDDPAYVTLRRRLQEFNFPTCLLCNSCDMIDSNQQDCFLNEPPVCGGCLWAQGYILCP
jgi:MoaA/NifB/PqqE/SkfB family radical SAM enzyme